MSPILSCVFYGVGVACNILLILVKILLKKQFISF